MIDLPFIFGSIGLVIYWFLLLQSNSTDDFIDLLGKAITIGIVISLIALHQNNIRSAEENLTQKTRHDEILKAIQDCK